MRPKLTLEALREVLCYKDHRVVRNDETILRESEMFQLVSPFTHSLAKREVEIRIYDDGEMGVFYGGRKLEVSPVRRPGGRPEKTIPSGIPVGLKTKLQSRKNGFNTLNTGS